MAPGLEALDYTVASLYGELERAGAAPVRADYAVEAAEADVETALQLGLVPGAAVLRTVQTTYSASNRVVELGSTTYRGDRYRFRASLYRPLAERPLLRHERNADAEGWGPAHTPAHTPADTPAHT